MITFFSFSLPTESSSCVFYWLRSVFVRSPSNGQPQRWPAAVEVAGCFLLDFRARTPARTHQLIRRARGLLGFSVFVPTEKRFLLAIPFRFDTRKTLRLFAFNPLFCASQLCWINFFPLPIEPPETNEGRVLSSSIRFMCTDCAAVK